MATSSVATSSVLLGAPQDEQKRPIAGTSVPQDEHEGMIFYGYSLTLRSKNALYRGLFARTASGQPGGVTFHPTSITGGSGTSGMQIKVHSAKIVLGRLFYKSRFSMPIGDLDGFGVSLSRGGLVCRVEVWNCSSLTLLALVAAGIIGTGLGLLVKFIVEANQTLHDRMAGVIDDASRK